MVLVPARQRRAVVDDVMRRPFDALLIQLAADIVVRAENIEIARARLSIMKSTVCSGVQAPAGFSVRFPAVSGV